MWIFGHGVLFICIEDDQVVLCLTALRVLYLNAPNTVQQSVKVKEVEFCT
jgi:hypothetical protein